MKEKARELLRRPHVKKDGLAVVALLCGTVLVALGKLSGEQWMYLTGAVIPLWLGARMMSRKSEGGGE